MTNELKPQSKKKAARRSKHGRETKDKRQDKQLAENAHRGRCRRPALCWLSCKRSRQIVKKSFDNSFGM